MEEAELDEDNHVPVGAREAGGVALDQVVLATLRIKDWTGELNPTSAVYCERQHGVRRRLVPRLFQPNRPSWFQGGRR